MNPDTRVLLQKMAGIHLLLATVELNHFAPRLVEKELLSYQSMNSILSTVGYTKAQQVQQLMESVVAQVTVTPKKFEDFVKILSADPALQRLAEELTKTYTVYTEDKGLPSGASQGSPDLPFHKRPPAVLTVQPSALCSPHDAHLPPDDHPPPPAAHPPLPDDYPHLQDTHPPSLTNAHSPVSNVHPPLPDVHQERRPTLAEPISCFPSHKPVLEKTINKLEEKFLEVVLVIQLDCNSLDINKIKICLTLLPSVMKQDHISFLMKYKQDIAHASSVIEIITLLNLYWDCFNYGLLEHLVVKCGCNQTKHLMEQFVRDVNAFMENTKLADFMDIWKGREEVPPGFSQLVVRHGLDPKQTTLCQVEQFRKDFCQHYSLHQVVLIFRSVRPGSVEVVWLIPSHVAEHLSAEMKNPEVGYKVLMQYSVLEILINGVAVFVCTSGKEEEDDGKKDGKTALDTAVKNSHKDIIDLLKSHQSKMYDEMSRELNDVRQQKERVEQQLHYTRQQMEQTDQELREMQQKKEQVEKQLCDVRQQMELELSDMRQQKEQAVGQLQYMRQKMEQELSDMKEQALQQLYDMSDMRQQMEQTDQELCEIRQQVEKERYDMRQQKEQVVQQLRDMKQQKEQAVQQLHYMQQQKEPTLRQLYAVRQQKEQELYDM